MKHGKGPDKSATAAVHAAHRGTRLHSLSHEALNVVLLYGLSAVALCWIFPPNGIWPLAFVGLVPWTVATCRTQRAWLVHWLSFFVGWGFFLVSLRWLMPVTGLGYAALALYLALYWTLAAWAIRTGRRHGISPMWSLPVVWVACEFLRATVMSGFPWLLISHGLYQQLALIQISDLAGAYGVSFIVVLVNGVLVELALRRWPAPGARISTRQLALGGTITLLLLVGSLVYGHYRLRQIDFPKSPATHGPRVAVIQDDFPLVTTPPYGERPQVVLSSYLWVAAQAAREKPDLVVFPETVWSAVQNLSFIDMGRAAIDDAHADTWLYGNLCHDALVAFARGDYPAVNAVISELERYVPSRELPRLPALGGQPVAVVVGSVSLEVTGQTYPTVKRYNSALVYDRDGSQRRQRYDKCHLVPFGEFVPFRYGRLHWLYRWLNSLSPFSGPDGRLEYSLTPGEQFTVFELPTEEGRAYTFGVPICYEDATPYVIREFAWDGAERRADFLVSISNDAWFQYSTELPQHLAICAFRAVENRVGIARSVNTGISGFVDPNGRIYSRVADAKGRDVGPGIIGYDLETVYLDPRSSMYGRFGDWFAGLCLVLTVVLWLGAVFERWVLALKHRIELRRAKGGR